MEDLKKVENYYNVKLTSEWGNGLHDFYIYEESTADGYSVYVATENNLSVCVSDDVYYYDSDLRDVLIYEIKSSGKLIETVIYVDDLDSYFVAEAMDELKELMEQEIKEDND